VGSDKTGARMCCFPYSLNYLDSMDDIEVFVVGYVKENLEVRSPYGSVSVSHE
jgi:hypothetical protein